MNMPIACKVCESDKKDSIEEMILQGHSNLHIANELKDMGIDISHASINRHKNTHMKEHEEKIKELASSKCNTKYDRNNNLGEINASEIYDEIKQQTLHGISYDELAKKIKALFNGKINIEYTERKNLIIHAFFDNSLIYKMFPNFHFTCIDDGLKLIHQQESK